MFDDSGPYFKILKDLLVIEERIQELHDHDQRKINQFQQHLITLRDVPDPGDVLSDKLIPRG